MTATSHPPKAEAEKASIFDNTQIGELQAKLDGRYVKERTQGSMKLSYIEGWHAIAEANRIFGHDRWDRETIMLECIWSGERMTKNGAKPAASYIARSRITIHGLGGAVIREGVGAGSGFGSDMGEAHESAAKEAETDAMKRALMTFGNPFGLALYDKHKANVTRPGQEPHGKPVAKGPKGGKPKPERNGKQVALEWSERGEARAAVYPFTDWNNIRLFLDDLAIAVSVDPRAWDTNTNDIERVREKINDAAHAELIDKLQEVELQLEQQFLAAG